MNLYQSLTQAGPLFAMFAGIEARLQAAFPPREFEHAVMPPRLSPSAWAKLVRRMPFVGLGFVGATPSAASGRRFDAGADWTLVMVNQNSRGHRERLLGDSLGIAQLGMAQVAAAALHGLTIPAVGTVSVTSLGNLWVEGWEAEGANVTGLNLRCGFSLVPAGDGTLDDFLRHAADWRIAEGEATQQSDLITVRDEA
ncbi:hypothetical protein [Falsiroseomonas sp.]|uniref:hypothetical protein n=1 Tax=Falsiroseomonas sp. TaxID=2870721 RepID=UPI003F6F52AE